ncbi:MAG: glutathione S-transferase family protein [Solirubrobacterales bacterium]
MNAAGTQSPAHELITIPISHYCEKARWALERAGISYREKAHLQVLHRIAARRAGGGLTVPVLVCPLGVFADSTEILEYADHAGASLYLEDQQAGGEVRTLEDHFDEVLGPHARRWMYHNISDQKKLVREYGATGIPGWQRRLLPVLWRTAAPVINRVLDIDDETAAASLSRTQEVFDEVGERLADGRRFLVGERFTAADLSFAALSAAVTVPEQYGVPLPQPHLLPEPMRSRVLEFRDHPAGRFALRMYAQERPGATRARRTAAAVA